MEKKKTTKRGRPPVKHTPKSIDDQIKRLISEIQQTKQTDEYLNDLGLVRLEKQMKHTLNKFEARYAIDRSK
jgi:hypothetical protein